MRALLPLLALLLCASCGWSSPIREAEEQALAAFRAEFGGVGRRPPWTTKIRIAPDGDWVVREISHLAVETRLVALDDEARRRGVEWRGEVMVTYWSRVIDAAAWRGPALPSSWDQYAALYRVERADGRLIVAPVLPSPGF
ncbi:MAG: hypothetical protein RMM58_09430 [Chloroflexota bacterium]|nr:hypothetical protein [Dehalococcoidia bacterium]MDW8254088.1 hypothetical protein [Chloroflexota bacterium]